MARRCRWSRSCCPPTPPVRAWEESRGSAGAEQRRGARQGSTLPHASAHAPPTPAPLRPPGGPVPGARPLFVAWQGDVTPTEGVLGVPAALASCLGLRAGAALLLRPLGGVPPAEAVVVEPLTGDDWEVVDLNAEHLEDRLLEQVHVF
jgi:hypothetical protein